MIRVSADSSFDETLFKMFQPPFPNRIYILLLVLLLMSGCIKTSSLIPNVPNIPVDTSNNSNNSNTDSDLGPPAVTAVGTPVGSKITKTIGPSGGSITSDDGLVDLNIPAGALSKNTDISIQSVTNECPGSLGLAYDLTPNGLKFSVPASLTFHYTDSLVNGTDPLILYSVFQDSLNQWEVNDADKEVDSVGKTVSFDVSHFTIYAMEPGVRISASSYQLKESQQAICVVWRFVKSKKGATGNTYNLIPSQPFVDDQVRFWAVNGFAGGSSEDGFIDIAGTTVPYTAPAKNDYNRYVEISVNVNEPETIRIRKAKIITFQDHTYKRKVKLLIGDRTYDVHIHFTALSGSGVYPDIYNDSADLVVEVKDGLVSVPVANIVNYRPTDNPTSWGDMEKGPGYVWVPDQTGVINITGATFGLIDNPNAPGANISILLSSTGTIIPTYTVKYPGDAPASTFGGDAVPGWPGALYFTYKDPAPFIVSAGTGYTVTERK